MTITESTGKRLPAIDIFTEAIRFIKKQFLETLQSERLKVQVKEDEVHYIITVPAIWSDLSKQFMRQAAIQVYYNYLRKEFHFSEVYRSVRYVGSRAK